MAAAEATVVVEAAVDATATNQPIRIQPETTPELESSPFPSVEFSEWTTPLLKALVDYQQLNRRRFHGPGHAGVSLGPEWEAAHCTLGFSSAALQFDLTELEGLDVLSEPEGCLRESQDLLAQRLDVAHSFYLINGSSVGLQASLLAAFQPGDKVLIPRNAHRSVLSGLILAGIHPVWCLPDWLDAWGLWGPLSTGTIETQLVNHPDIKGIVLTHPTYEGVLSPLDKIAKVCQANNLTLIVDEAHGGPFALSSQIA